MPVYKPTKSWRRVSGAWWHVLGAGSMGCLFAHNLHLGGAQVHLLLRHCAGKQLRQLVVEQGTICHQYEVLVGATADSGDIDFLLVTTKAYDVIAAVDSVAHRLHSSSVVLLLCNGLGLAEQIAKTYPQLRLYQGTTTEGAYRVADLHIRHAGVGVTRIGARSVADAPSWLAVWEKGPLEVVWERDIAAALWHKLAINCAINPLTALHRCNNGELGEQPQLKQAVAALCDEIALVSEAAGFHTTATTIHASVAQIIAATAGNRSSMLQDVLAGRRTEIDYINGHMVGVALQYGISATHNNTLLKEIKSSER